jgi:septal ring factor EnvC (AmiA/AmiB activator)
VPPATLNKRLNDVIIAVEVLQQESRQRNAETERLVTKMDKTIDQFQDLSLKMTEMLTKHDTSITSLDHRMNQHESENTATIKELREDQKALQARVTKLEQWKWMILGGSAALGFIAQILLKFIGG